MIYSFADDTTIVSRTYNIINDYNTYMNAINKSKLLINENKTVIISKNLNDKETNNFFSRKRSEITNSERLLEAKITIFINEIDL